MDLKGVKPMHRMLIVDDEPIVRKGLKETIDWSKENIEITHTAKHGGEALEIVKNHAIDLVITDIRMPIMDGVEFIQAVKALGLDLNIVVLSGYKDFEYAKTSLESGAFTYLLKPIDNQELIDKVKEARDALEASREKTSFQKTATEDLGKLREFFIIDALKGRIETSDHYRHKSQQYGLPVIEEGTLVYVQNEVALSDPSDALDKFREALIEEKHLKEPPSYYAKMNPDTFVYVHGITDKKKVQTAYEHALFRYESSEGETFLIGLSTFSSFEGLAEAYQLAKTRAQGKPYPYLNHIVSDETHATLKPQVREALEYIAKHYDENITVKTVSEALYVSDSYLMHAFKDNLNRTFNEYLTTYRLKKAKELLLNSHYHVYEIADKVGYGDVKYFSQVFKKHTGMSPREYTKAHKYETS